MTIDLAHNQNFQKDTLDSLIQLLTYLRDAGYRVRNASRMFRYTEPSRSGGRLSNDGTIL